MTALPPDFCSLMADTLGPAEAETLCRALVDTEPGVSLRLNPQKPAASAPEGASVGWCAAGRRLDSRPPFTRDPLLHAGAYYVQEAASMFVEQAYRTLFSSLPTGGERPLRALDLCAAPGGKSTLWRTLLPDGALLVANEPERPRREVLQENLAKWGQPDVVVAQAMPADFARLGGFFDIIAADVPCSGEGMFRKDSDARRYWSREAVERCAARQRAIVADVWPALREDGWLVYSTCTFNSEENERNVRWICRELGAEVVEIPLQAAWRIFQLPCGEDGAAGYRFLPHRTEGEGFFLALLRKTSGATAWRAPKVRPSKGVQGAAEAAEWLVNAADFRIFEPAEGCMSAVRKSLWPAVEALCGAVRVTQAGVPLAVRKGRKLVPAHELSLSTVLRHEAFPCVTLTLDEALAYLRRESLCFPPATPRGYCLLFYDGQPIGFANNLGARANNLYPQHWRIRHG